jgi:hypothetical protein
MPNYEDFKKYGEMEKQKKAAPTAPEPAPEKPEGGVKKLFGKLKGSEKG